MSLLRKILVVALTLAVATPTAGMAASNEPITVRASMARILRISAPAATVIIGNPGVADVTIQDPQTLVLTGKSYGETNLIILDSRGSAIADTMVSVVEPLSADGLTMYQGQARNTLNCQPICQPTVMLGDDATFATGPAGSSATITGMAK